MKYLLLLLVSTNLFAATAGPNLAGTGADDASIGTLTWTNPGNITAADTTYATNTSSAGNATHYLKGTNFGFSIPAGATINGIQLDTFSHKNGSGGGGYVDSTVSIVKSSGTIGATNKATSTQLSNPSDAVVSYGGAADLWGETWTATDINSANFGAVVSYTSANNTSSVSVDYFKITITYTAASAFRNFFSFFE